MKNLKMNVIFVYTFSEENIILERSSSNFPIILTYFATARRMLIPPTRRLDRSPLWHACAGGHSAVMQLLLDHGADPSLADDAGVSPIDSAKNGRINAVAEMSTLRPARLCSTHEAEQRTRLEAKRDGCKECEKYVMQCVCLFVFKLV